MEKQITIKDIAKEAGVSTATVSMILNSKDKSISQATRNRVLDIAENRNYVPNIMARSLVTRKTKTIGLVIPDITNPFFPEIARGAEDKASETGYSVIYCNTDDKLKREDRCIKILAEKMVDGIIFAHSAERDGTELKKYRVPIVLIDRDFKAVNVVGKVLVDNELASKQGVNYLIERGYKRIAYIAGSMGTQTAQERLSGYQKALMEQGLEYQDEWVKKGDYRSQWGYEAVKEFKAEGLEFDAIFCGNDLIAIGAIKALKELGTRIPEDMGILGFDDIYLAGMAAPPLTTVHQPIYKMGYKAAEILIQAIESDSIRRARMKKDNEETAPTSEEAGVRFILETELVVRSSTK